MFGSQHLQVDAKQLYHLNLDGGQCELAAPAPALSRYIDYYWLLNISAPSLDLQVIPDTAIDLVLSPDIADFAALYFPVSDPYDIKLAGPVQYSGVCFRSEYIGEIVGAELDRLKEFSIGADTIENLRLEPMVSAIQQSCSMVHITDVYNRFWLKQLGEISPVSETPARISHHELLALLEQAMGSGTIASICNTLGVSERQFRRLSVELFGVSPKKLQRIMRLQAALSELFHADASQLQDLYYDDSHRIRELKRLTGCTPRQIRQLAEKYNNG